MKKIFLLALSASLAFTYASAMQSVPEYTPSKLSTKISVDYGKGIAVEQRVNRSTLTMNGVKDKVMTVKKLKGNKHIKIMRKADGRMYKVLENNQYSPMSVKKTTPVVKSDAQAPTFYENFSEYDGESYDWIPEGWKDVSKADPANVAPGEDSELMNLTWCTMQPYYYDAIDGKYLAYCQVSMEYGDNVEKDQDEWLITPTMKAEQGKQLSFYFGYNPGWSLLDLDTYTFKDTPYSKGEAYVSTDDGATWEKVWDNLTDLKTYSEDDLWNWCYSYSPAWLYVTLDMSKYYGKDIKVAFRYVGKGGESVDIDAVKMNYPTPAAYYMRPAGYFMNGYSKEFEGPNNHWLLAPSSVTSVWMNASNEDSKSFKWTYTDPDSPELFDTYSEDRDLEVFYREGISFVPMLTASAPGGVDSTYTWNGSHIVYGGSNMLESSDGKKALMGATNLDLNKGFGTLAIDDGQYLFGTGSDDTWAGVVGKDNAKITAIGNYFDKPLSPYLLSNVWVNAKVTATPDAKFKLSVYSVSDDGVLSDEPIATASCTGADIITTEDQSSIPFDLIPAGSTDKSVLTISDAIFIKLEGFTDANTVSTFAPYNQSEFNADGESNAYFYLTASDAGEDEVTSLYPASAMKLSGETINTSFFFNLDAVYPYLEPADEATNNTVNYQADELGEIKTFQLNSYYNPSTWNIVKDMDWVSTATRVNSNPYSDYNSYLDVAIEALPADVTSRTATVTVSIPGNKYVTYVISQGASGVSAVVANSINVSVSNGNFVISAPANVSNVEIFNIAGKMVAKSQLKGASTIVDCQSMPHGAYLLKFNNGSTVKTIK